jgi:hypothetical protein
MRYGVLEGRLRILLSYNAADAWLTEAFRASLFLSYPALDVVLSPDPCAAPRPDASKPIHLGEFDALLLVAGPSGLTIRQQAELTAATKRAAQDKTFILLPVLAGPNASAPEKDLKNREWFRAPVVTDRNMICSLVRVLEPARC